MFRDYELVSPSLEGLLSHESFAYEGLTRPTEVLRVCDGPAARSRVVSDGSGESHSDKTAAPRSPADQKIIEDYFHDLYGIFMKKLSFFLFTPEVTAEDSVKLQAMLQEMIKMKKLIGRGRREVEKNKKAEE